MATTLHDKQVLFVRLVGILISWAYEHGYELTFGEAVRTPIQATANALNGSGIANSNHLIRLAIDFNLFKDGKYLVNSSDHKPLGDYWKSLDPLCRWGGDFHKPDGNHYSLEHENIC